MNDLIDRQAALDIFKPWLDVKGYSEGELNMLRAVIYELETMPSTSAWVSVKDRLPEIEKSVLIYYPKWDGDEIQVAKLEDDGMMFDICGEFNIGTGVVTHWMPLPQKPESKSGAEWVDNKCSVCGKGIENLIESREWYENEKPNYCPFCGTMFIMKGSDAE